MLASGQLPGGGFPHGKQSGAFLGDSVAMAQAFVDLYTSTADPAWLTHAAEVLRFIERTFRAPQGGYLTASGTNPAGTFGTPVRQLDENVAMVRAGASLYQYTGDTGALEAAHQAMKLLSSPSSSIISRRGAQAGILLADDALRADPVHITVVGSRSDQAAAALFAAALAYPSRFRRIEWWDRRAGPLPRADVTYPQVPRAEAFCCFRGACSLPVVDPARLAAAVERFQKPPGP